MMRGQVLTGWEALQILDLGFAIERVRVLGRPAANRKCSALAPLRRQDLDGVLVLLGAQVVCDTDRTF